MGLQGTSENSGSGGKGDAIRNYLPLVSREWRNGVQLYLLLLPFFHSLLTKGREKGARQWHAEARSRLRKVVQGGLRQWRMVETLPHQTPTPVWLHVFPEQPTDLARKGRPCDIPKLNLKRYNTLTAWSSGLRACISEAHQHNLGLGFRV